MLAAHEQDVAAELPRVLLENYLMLAAAIENQNMGRLPDMLQYSQRVHQNLLQVTQQIEDAHMLAMATSSAQAAPGEEEEEDGEDEQPEPGLEPELDELHEQHEELEQRAAEPQQQREPQLQRRQQQQQHQLQLQLQQQQPPPQLPPQPPPQPRLGARVAQPPQPAWLAHVNEPVGQLLASLGLAEFTPLLQQQRVDMAALSLLEERHLRELGLPLGAVVKLKAALAAQQAG